MKEGNIVSNSSESEFTHTNPYSKINLTNKQNPKDLLNCENWVKMNPI